MVPWNSFPLQIIYQVFGWLAFLSWSLAGYPQLISNFRRKSVVGLSLDYTILNFTKHWSYLIYNASLFFSPVIQKQYFEKYGYGQSRISIVAAIMVAAVISDIVENRDQIRLISLNRGRVVTSAISKLIKMIPVAANDVAFSTHAVIINLIVISQFAIYGQGTQKLSKYVIAIVAVVWFSASVCFFIALPTQSWLWLISIFNSIQVCMTLIKYCPQAFMNFLRKSTDGFSIGNVLLDFSGGIFNYSQMVVQSIDQDSLVNFYGNIGKVMISLVTIFYDSILMFQHYILYSHKKVLITSENSEEIQKPLIHSSSSVQQIHDSV